jgi:DNA-binding transcriptional LysR family regulator
MAYGMGVGSAMADLEMRLLRYFVEVAEALSFTDAASRLHVTQPALSQGIRRLEALVGAPLIERGPRGSTRALRLTDSGEALLPSAQEILRLGDRALKAVRRNARRVQVRIGFGTSTPRQLTRLALRSADGMSHVEALVEYVPWGEEVGWLARGDVDLLFIQAERGYTAAGVIAEPVQSIHRMAVFNSEHPLAHRGSVSMADLADEPIIDAASDRDYWIVSPRPTGRLPIAVGPPARTAEEMLTFVSLGRGMAITSSSVAERQGSADLAFVPIIDIDSAMVYLAMNASDRRPEVAALFAETLRLSRLEQSADAEGAGSSGR